MNCARYYGFWHCILDPACSGCIWHHMTEMAGYLTWLHHASWRTIFALLSLLYSYLTICSVIGFRFCQFASTVIDVSRYQGNSNMYKPITCRQLLLITYACTKLIVLDTLLSVLKSEQFYTNLLVVAIQNVSSAWQHRWMTVLTRVGAICLASITGILTDTCMWNNMNVCLNDAIVYKCNWF
jgi:hypothetical protein